MPNTTHFNARSTLDVGGNRYDIFRLDAVERAGYSISRLPYSLRILLENLLRYEDRLAGTSESIEALAKWDPKAAPEREISFTPARVLLQDFTGVPAVVDFAAMRDAMKRMGGDPKKINPLQPAELVIDHSVQVDEFGTRMAFRYNVDMEYRRNGERYAFLKWGAKAFDNFRVVPPGSGICHQINLEYLARVVWTGQDGGQALAYPDSVLGMDSHTPMINSLGVVGWGVGGLEGGTAALGEPVSMLIPEVVGCRLAGAPRPGITATDIVLSITQVLRRHSLVGAFVEYVGPGVDALSALDRATVSNMTPEIGATMGYFPVDAETLRFLAMTGRSREQIALVEAYARAQGLWRDAGTPEPDYSRVIEIDLAAIEPSVAGPRRPHERNGLSQVPRAFLSAFPPRGGSGDAGADGSGDAGSAAVAAADGAAAHAGTRRAVIRDGDVAIAAITSCTNTANPAVMIAAGLLARNAVRRGLAAAPWVKASLSPGSRIVRDYLERGGLLEPLGRLGFHVAGYGCMTCIGNSGPLAADVAGAIEENDSKAVAVLSGNRNFEGRVHPLIRASFLASPPLVVAYALAGSVLVDLEAEPLGRDPQGHPVLLRDIWPEPGEIQAILAATLSPALYTERYADVEAGTEQWRAIATPTGVTFGWQPSTFIRRPPFFEGMAAEPAPRGDIVGARALAVFGDMLTTDHISPIGVISAGTPAAQYLASQGVAPADFINYGARRLNHDVMVRGTFANIRIRNEMAGGREGGYTRHMPGGELLSIHEAAERYRGEGVPVVVVGGADYGAGSSRDWAAKGTSLLGVRAVIAESFERIHRSNLVGMGVLPAQFPPGVTRRTLGLDGSERFTIAGLAGGLAPRAALDCTIAYADGRSVSVRLTARLDTQREVDYYRHGGILHYATRQRLR